MSDLGQLIRANGFETHQDLINHFLDHGRRPWGEGARLADGYEVDLNQLIADRNASLDRYLPAEAPAPAPAAAGEPVPATGAGLEPPTATGGALAARPPATDRPELVDPPEAGYPSVAFDAQDSPVINDLQHVINAAGYTDADGEPLVIDGDSGPKTQDGLRWLAGETGSPTHDPQDPVFWNHLDTYAEHISGERADAVRAAVDHALDALTFPEPPEGGYPLVSDRAFDNETIRGLQGAVNAAGYAEATGEPALATDGDSGDKTRAGLTWLAEQTGSPTANPDDERFWQHLHRFSERSEDTALQTAITRALERPSTAALREAGASYTPGEGDVVIATNGVRTGDLDPNLRRHLDRMSEELGLRVVVWSGGQPASGSNRTGSTRHDHGDAADIYVEDANGRRLSGAELAPVVEWWFRNDIGSVGYGMDEYGHDTGLHLDIHRNRDRFWRYGGAPIPRAVLDAVPEAHRQYS